MGANQLASLKTATLFKFSDTLNDIDRKHGMDDADIYDLVECQDGKTRKINKRVKELLAGEIASLNKANMNGTRSGMNPILRELLGISTDKPRNR